MKKVLKMLGLGLGTLLGLILLLVLGIFLYANITASATLKKCRALEGEAVKTLTVDGVTFRDLNKNGRLDIYEDPAAPIEDRVNNLVSQMTLEEKAGTMFINAIGMNQDGSLAQKISLKNPFVFSTTSEMLFLKKMHHFNIFAGTGTREMATWYNNLQKLAERTRLGIPVTIASDPRNHYSTNVLAASMSGDFSQFPEALGLGAIGDSAVVAEFADIARREYLAVGIRLALHPQVDLATEPRWWRVSGTFGEDAQLTARLATAYIKGFQGDTIGPQSVACMTKHFPGGGPQKEGIDPHFHIQKGQVYPGNRFSEHLLPFEAAFRAGTAEIMPYYGVPKGITREEVGFSFNKEIITGLLRNKYHFEGIVCTDWGLVTDSRFLGINILPARAWGMEEASRKDRVLRIINAGVDQLGGESCPELLVSLVNEGKVTMARLDSSVKRILTMKFKLGLFDNPYVDVDKAVNIVGNPRFRAAADRAQRRSFVLLKNDTLDNHPLLPLTKGVKIFVKNMDTACVARYGTVVEKPEEADIALIRLSCPGYHLKGTGLLGLIAKGGDLDFKGKEKAEILDLLSRAPSVVDIALSRPAVIPDIAAASRGLFASFGASDEAFLEVVFGNSNPRGKLPVEMPSSMEAVRNQLEDVPHDSKDPLFPFGYGLHYQTPQDTTNRQR